MRTVPVPPGRHPRCELHHEAPPPEEQFLTHEKLRSPYPYPPPRHPTTTFEASNTDRVPPKQSKRPRQATTPRCSMSSHRVKSSKRTTFCDNRDQFDVIGVLLHGGRDVHRRSWMRAGSVPRRWRSRTSTETPGADLELAVAVAAGRDHGAVGQTPHRVSLPGCYGTRNWHGDLLRDRFPGILPVSAKIKNPAGPLRPFGG